MKSTVRVISVSLPSTDPVSAGKNNKTANSNGKTAFIGPSAVSVIDSGANKCGTTISNSAISKYAMTDKYSQRTRFSRAKNTRPPTSENRPLTHNANSHQFSHHSPAI